MIKKQKRNEAGFLMIDVKPLLYWDEPNGEGGIVSDMITKEGWKVGYMFREDPMPGYPDSGWRFFKGDENEAYMSDSNKHHVFALNTVCNYDLDIIPYLHMPVGTHLIRTKNGKFIIDDGTNKIYFEKQK